MFEQQEQKFSKIGARGLHKLKYMYDSRKLDDYEGLRFELKTIFTFIDALEPKEMKIMIDDTYKKIEKLEFNPTVSGPNITIRDRMRRDFSIWYKPLFYIPTPNSARQLMADFIVFRGTHDSMYAFDDALKKELYTYEFLSNAMLREISIKMLSRLKPVHLVINVKKNFQMSDVNHLKTTSFFLKPHRMLLVSEDYLPESVKINMPINLSICENVDMNAQKFTEMAKRLI